MEVGELKACGQCGMAKRKCSRQFPTCSRCQTKGLECVYPAPRPSWFIFYGPEDKPPEPNQTPTTLSGITDMSLPDLVLSNIDENPPSESNLDLVAYSNPPSFPMLPDLQSSWFLTPNSWSVAPLKLSSLFSGSKASALQYLHRMRGWLADWVAQGSNTFIHSRLYQIRRPPCILDAFAALSSYLARTPATEDFVYTILETRAASLINEAKSEAMSPYDCYGHLSRVQALFIYTIIRLFDSDIRQRYLAEQQLPTLRTWSSEMLSVTRRAAISGHLLQPNSIDGDERETGVEEISVPTNQQEAFWHAWILSESTRRTWVVSQMVYGIYITLQQGISECPGSLLFTTLRGVWDAPTAISWTKICTENDTGFMRRDEIERLLVDCKPMEVDDFGKALIELDFGQERLEVYSRIGTEDS